MLKEEGKLSRFLPFQHENLQTLCTQDALTQTCNLYAHKMLQHRHSTCMHTRCCKTGHSTITLCTILSRYEAISWTQCNYINFTLNLVSLSMKWRAKVSLNATNTFWSYPILVDLAPFQIENSLLM